MPIEQITAEQAYKMMQEDAGMRYLDVRTVEEFEAGHPAGALNVPILVRGAGGRRTPNTEFLTVVVNNIPRSTRLLLGCQSGARSRRACEVLAAAGYTNIRNVRGGFGGLHDGNGHVLEQGWRDAGLPVERGGEEGRRYEDLRGNDGGP